MRLFKRTMYYFAGFAIFIAAFTALIVGFEQIAVALGYPAYYGMLGYGLVLMVTMAFGTAVREIETESQADKIKETA